MRLILCASALLFSVASAYAAPPPPALSWLFGPGTGSEPPDNPYDDSMINPVILGPFPEGQQVAPTDQWAPPGGPEIRGPLD